MRREGFKEQRLFSMIAGRLFNSVEPQFASVALRAYRLLSAWSEQEVSELGHHASRNVREVPSHGKECSGEYALDGDVLDL